MLFKTANHASRHTTSHEESWFRLACAHEHVGEYAEAEHLYRAILERNAHYTSARLRLVMLLRHDRHRVNEALPLLDAGIAIQPNHSQLHSTRALVLIAMQRQYDAQESLASACTCPDNTSHFDAFYHLGTLCNTQSNQASPQENTLIEACHQIELRCNSKME